MFLIGGLALLALVILGMRAFMRSRPDALARRLLRIGAATLFFAAAALALARQFGLAAAALATGVGLWQQAGLGPVRSPSPHGPALRRMAREDAARILGISPDAGEAEILAAHRAQMKRHHPDAGGSAEYAAQLNAARDLLLGR